MNRDDLSNVKVGDTLILTENSRGYSYEVTVVKAGPKRIGVVRTANSPVEYFRRDTGGVPNYSFPHVRTPQFAAEQRRRLDAERELRNLGLEMRFEFRHSIPTDKLEAIVWMLKDEPLP